MVRVLFVCMGNICRSPTAHGVFEAMVKQEGLDNRIQVDSAGTHSYHIGKQPDSRAQQTARARGLDLSYLRARQARVEDFSSFDYVLAMDEDNYRDLMALCPEGLSHKLNMFLDFAPRLGFREVPDPYYGGADGFDQVFDMVEAASTGLLNDIREKHL
jgi:protein-tyrosine phosphatase